MSNQTLTNNATNLAVSTPKDFDVKNLVKLLFVKKQDENGRTTMSTSRGKQTLFAATCSWIKSMRGIAREQHLSLELETEIKTAITEVIAEQFTALQAEYDTFVIRRGGLVTKFDKSNTISHREAFSTIKASRIAESKEQRLSDMLTLTSVEARINSILDKTIRTEQDEKNLVKVQKQAEQLRAALREAKV